MFSGDMEGHAPSWPHLAITVEASSAQVLEGHALSWPHLAITVEASSAQVLEGHALSWPHLALLIGCNRLKHNVCDCGAPPVCFWCCSS